MDLEFDFKILRKVVHAGIKTSGVRS